MPDDHVVIHRFEPYADHLAFVISDADATEGVFDGETWDKADDAWRIAVERHCIVVGTARYDYVPVTLTRRETAPAVEELDAVDHVVEADLELPSGKLAVTGATGLPDEVEPLPLPPGRYRVRIVYSQTDLRPSRYNPKTLGTTSSTNSRCGRQAKRVTCGFSNKARRPGRIDSCLCARPA